MSVRMRRSHNLSTLWVGTYCAVATLKFRLAIPPKYKQRVTMWPSHSGHIPKRNENMSIQNLVHDVHSSISRDSQEVETIQTSIHWQTDDKMWYVQKSGKLFANKNKWCIDTCHNVAESWKHHGEWNKPVAVTKYRVTLFTWKIQNRQPCGGRQILAGGGRTRGKRVGHRDQGCGWRL